MVSSVMPAFKPWKAERTTSLVFGPSRLTSRPSTLLSTRRAGGMAISAPQRKAARRKNHGSRSKRSMKLTSKKIPAAGTAGMKMAASTLSRPYSARAEKVMRPFRIRVTAALMARKSRPVPAMSQRVRMPMRCGRANCMVTPAPSRLSSSSSSQGLAASSGSGCFGKAVPPALLVKAERGDTAGNAAGKPGGVTDSDSLGTLFRPRLLRFV